MKKFIGIGLIASTILVGCGPDQIEIEEAVFTYEELQEEIEVLESEANHYIQIMKAADSEMADMAKEWDRLESGISDMKEEHEGLTELAENREQVEKEVNQANQELESLQAEIEKLQGEIVQTENDPIKVNPGFYYFGEDIEPGRYKIMAQEGQRGNVFIRSSNGRSYVNEIFGDGSRHTTKEFTFSSNNGDELEATIPVYLYPAK